MEKQQHMLIMHQNILDIDVLCQEKFVAFDNAVEREGNAKLTTNLSAEHIVALTTGGNDIIPNIVPTVLQYNVQKWILYIRLVAKSKRYKWKFNIQSRKIIETCKLYVKSLQARKDLGIKRTQENIEKDY